MRLHGEARLVVVFAKVYDIIGEEHLGRVDLAKTNNGQDRGDLENLEEGRGIGKWS